MGVWEFHGPRENRPIPFKSPTDTMFWGAAEELVRGMGGSGVVLYWSCTSGGSVEFCTEATMPPFCLFRPPVTSAHAQLAKLVAKPDLPFLP